MKNVQQRTVMIHGWKRFTTSGSWEEQGAGMGGAAGLLIYQELSLPAAGRRLWSDCKEGAYCVGSHSQEASLRAREAGIANLFLSLVSAPSTLTPSAQIHCSGGRRRAMAGLRGALSAHCTGSGSRCSTTPRAAEGPCESPRPCYPAFSALSVTPRSPPDWKQAATGQAVPEQSGGPITALVGSFCKCVLAHSRGSEKLC